MCCLDQSGKLGGRDERYVPRAFAPDDDRLLLVDNLIQNAGQVLPEAGIRGLGRHGIIVQDSCTFRTDGVEPLFCEPR